ncbi:MAG: hypothetical protein ACFFDM_12960 [Candidatus Thorarchaeota archaeon]
MSTEMGRFPKLSNFGILLFTIILLLVVLFAPFAYHFDLGPGPDSIEAVVWQYIESPWQMGFWFQNPFRYFDYVFVRLLFPIQFLRYQFGKSRRNVTLLVALYSEIHAGLLSLPVYISWLYQLGPFLSPGGDPIRPVFLPIPLLFFVTSFLILIVERRR